MKSIEGYNKLRGGYYTPCEIADFICEWVRPTPRNVVLEPSCGDGSFLAALKNKKCNADVVGVELDPKECEKAKKYGYRVESGDFFTFYNDHIEGKAKYDVVIGNPPFIRYQNFDEEYRTVAFDLLKKHGFHPNRLTNIWLPFLLLCCEALSPEGRIGMIIPAELFQVDYAAEAREYLSLQFESLTLVTFRKLVFDDIQQEVVILLGAKKSQTKGIQVVELEGVDELVRDGLLCLDRAEMKNLDHSKDKWIKYFLSNEELMLLNRLNNDERITDATKLYEVNVGLVSGENDFFLCSWDKVIKCNLKNDITPIVSRSEQIKGIILSEEDYSDARDKGKKVSLFTPGDKPFEELSENARKYIKWGERQGYNKNYKCRIRKRWYHVPLSWKADAFLIRQANIYPKMIMNSVGALVTDTLHKVRFLDGVDGCAVTAAFLNTYTLALGETLGRSYGGGVLTFEPGEMRRMRIPMLGAEKLDLRFIDSLQRTGKYEEILNYTDKVLLMDNLKLSKKEVELLHSIWDKMRDRRLCRKHRS